MEKLEEEIRYIRVFVPYAQYNHIAYYAYDVNEYGKLEFGAVVLTSMGVGAVIDPDVAEESPGNFEVKQIFRMATEKETKKFNKDWWQPILQIYECMNRAE